MNNSAANWGIDRPRAKPWTICCSRSLNTRPSGWDRNLICSTSPAVSAGGTTTPPLATRRHRLDDLRSTRVLGQIAGRSFFERLEDHGAVGERGQQEHTAGQAIAFMARTTASPSMSGIW